jgi:hypothetical protein
LTICLPHSRRVFLIDAKHDGLLKSVAGFFEEFCDLLRREQSAVVEH